MTKVLHTLELVFVCLIYMFRLLGFHWAQKIKLIDDKRDYLKAINMNTISHVTLRHYHVCLGKHFVIWSFYEVGSPIPEVDMSDPVPFPEVNVFPKGYKDAIVCLLH